MKKLMTYMAQYHDGSFHLEYKEYSGKITLEEINTFLKDLENKERKQLLERHKAHNYYVNYFFISLTPLEG